MNFAPNESVKEILKAIKNMFVFMTSFDGDEKFVFKFREYPSGDRMDPLIKRHSSLTPKVRLKLEWDNCH